MMPLTDMTGLTGNAFALAVLLMPLAAARVTGRTVLLYVVVCMALALAPFDGLSVAGYLRGWLGDLSIAAHMLLALAVQQRMSRGEAPVAGRNGLLVLIALAAFSFYPFALGIGLFDPYRLGFGNFGLLAGLFALALLASHKRKTAIALWLALAVLAWAIGWYESGNLWDYLLDPWVSIYAIGALLRRGVIRVVERVRRN